MTGTISDVKYLMSVMCEHTDTVVSVSKSLDVQRGFDQWTSNSIYGWNYYSNINSIRAGSSR